MFNEKKMNRKWYLLASLSLFGADFIAEYYLDLYLKSNPSSVSLVGFIIAYIFVFMSASFIPMCLRVNDIGRNKWIPFVSITIAMIAVILMFFTNYEAGRVFGLLAVPFNMYLLFKSGDTEQYTDKTKLITATTPQIKG